MVRKHKNYVVIDKGNYEMHVMIRLYRNMQGWTQEKLARKCGLSRNTISSIETGQYCVTAFHAGLICRALHVEFEELFRIRKKIKEEF